LTGPQPRLFYGGAPAAIVPDNLKSAVTRSDCHEPTNNPDFAAFAEHYGCAVVPARVRHPKDKALVENDVKLMYRSVYVDLEGNVIKKVMDEINKISHKKFQERDLIGRVYKYFLQAFAINANKDDGEFYTPQSIVELIATLIEP